MGLFASIMDKIFHHGGAPAAQPVGAQPAPVAAALQTAVAPASAPQPASAPPEPVDVEEVLMTIASQKGGGGNWRTSIVDLLKLLDLDSSLDARKDLANELNVHSGEDGTAGENIALYKAVMQKLVDNGGKVPESLKD